MATYKFNRVYPPLLRDIRDIYSVPADDLVEKVGTAKWTKTTNFDGILLHGDVSFDLKRNRHWSIQQPPMHYATESQHEITVTKGYSKTTRVLIERALEISAGAPGFGLSAEARASLHITNETIEEWRLETVTTEQRTFKANSTYVTWSLVDSLILDKKTILIRGKHTNDKELGKTVDEPLQLTFDVIVGIYEDMVPDDKQEGDPDDGLLRAGRRLDNRP
jgi:hypothetical protein